MTSYGYGLALVVAAAIAQPEGVQPMTVEEEARALIGVEYSATLPSQRIAPHLSCIYEGGGGFAIDGISSGDLGLGIADCQGRHVLFLERVIGRQGRHAILRIVETEMLPPYVADPGPQQLTTAWRLTGNDECEIKDRPNTFFLALVRWGKRKRIDWRTGVKQAWTFDLEAGRIVPLSTRNIVCYWYEP